MSQSSLDILNQIVQGGQENADWTTNLKLQQMAAAKQAQAVQQATQKGFNQASAGQPGTQSGDAFGMFMKAVAQQESGGNYGALGSMVGGDRAYGKYQVMGANVANWTKEALGYSMDPNAFLQNKAAQDQVAKYKLGQLFRQFGPKQGAAAWNQGVAGMQAGGGHDYAKEVMQRMQQFGYQAGQQNPTSAGYGKWMSPLNVMPSDPTSGYGWRINPVSGQRSFHEGADYGAALGSRVSSAQGGHIVSSGWDPIYGNQVIVGNKGIRTMYGHLNKINPRFSEGDMINAGQRLGQVGSTGWSTGPHLHFGVSKGGEYVNPSRFFSGQLRGGNPSQQQPAQQRSNRKNVNDALKNTGRDFSHILQNLGL